MVHHPAVLVLGLKLACAALVVAVLYLPGSVRSLVPQDGVTYVVSGAGAKLHPTGREAFTAVSSSTLHYLDLLVYEDRMVDRAIDQAGYLVDTFTPPE